jgi:hypothetical protein
VPPVGWLTGSVLLVGGGLSTLLAFIGYYLLEPSEPCSTDGSLGNTCENFTGGDLLGMVGIVDPKVGAFIGAVVGLVVPFAIAWHRKRQQAT